MYESNLSGVQNKRGLIKSNSSDILFLLIAISIIFLMSIFHINENNGIKIWPDEIGFWLNAALLNGEDWSGTGSTISYYGFGLGFLLAPIMAVLKSSTSVMHIAVVLQSLMLCSTIVATYLILSNLKLELGNIAQKVLIVLPILYPSYLLFTRITLAETVLVTCMWWWLYASLKFIKNITFPSGLFTVLIPLYMYAVHQRALPYIFIAAIIVILNCFVGARGKSKKEHVIGFSLLLIILGVFLLTKAYETYYINELYSNSVNLSVNTVSGHTSSIFQMFFTLEGWIQIIQSICGKIYYSLVATFGLIFWGIVAGVYSGYQILTKKSNDKVKDLFYLLVLINFLSAISVSSLAMLGLGNYSIRNDALMYGRYSEFSFGAMILIGGITLYQNVITNISKRRFLITGCIIISLLCLVCLNLTFNDASNDVFWISCSALGDLQWLSNKFGLTNKEIVLVSGLRTILFMMITYYILIKFDVKESILTVWFIAIAFLWVWIANIGWDQNVMSWYKNREKNQIDITQDLGDESIIGILDVTYPGCLQFYLPDSYFENIETISSLSDQDEGMYIITDASSEYAHEIMTEYNVCKKNDYYILWVYE